MHRRIFKLFNRAASSEGGFRRLQEGCPVGEAEVHAENPDVKKR